jgi:hypothetical protein
MSAQKSAGRAEEPLSQKPDLIPFASCSHKRMSFIWRSCQKQLQSRLRRNTKSPCRNTTAPSSRRDLLDLHRWGGAWVRDPREVYSRLPGRCQGVACALRRKMGTMANTHLTAPPPITQNPVQRSRAAKDISRSARRKSDIPATVRPRAIINIIRFDAY